MCGIYGYLSRNGNVRPEFLTRMGDVLRHRGPDDEGTYVRNYADLSIGLGHQRLAILDLSSAGRQPMANEDGAIRITFNGEIYNFRKLRKELLGRGHTFKSSSDTEVVIHLYEEMGTDCLSRLEGMFAFALWDEEKKLLFLARDRIGKKPLHYAVDDEGIVFASEIKALLQHPKVSREIDPGALNKYLTYEYVPAPHSIFKAIKKLEPGHFLVYGDGAIRETKYWDIPLSDFAIGYKTESEYTIELREILENAVAARLVADVPVGIFLSGGLDSSLVAALAKKSNDQVECFSIGFEEKSFDESRYALQVARSLKLKHHLEVFAMKDVLENLDALSRLLDEPLADASILPTYLLSKITSEKVKVALSGDGGDELFAGYPTYQAHRLITYYDSLPEPVKEAVKAVAARLPVSHSNISHDFKIKQFLRGAGVSSEIRFFVWMGGFLESEKRLLLTDDLRRAAGDLKPFEDILRYIRECGLTKDLERILYLSIKLYLQDNILVKVDRASMANSLEVRSPFLDQRVVEFACGLPTLYKLNGLTTKYLLKKAAAGLLPKDIILRKKKGFGIPVSRWLGGELKGVMTRYLSPERIKQQGFFNELYVKNLMEEHLAKKKDNRKLLWTLLVFQIWHENHLATP